MPSWSRSAPGVFPATATSQRLTKSDATEPTSGLSPSAMRRSMPRRNASAAARYCSRENKRVTLTGTPEKIASSIAGRPSFVPGILINTLGRAARANKSIAEAKDLFARAARPNVLIKIPGTKEGLPAIEEAIFSGVPVNVTLLFSREQYLAAAEAFLRGIERRIADGLNPDVGSVASLFVSRWDVAVAGKTPGALRDQLGIAIAKRTYKAAHDLLNSPRWERVYNLGARPQRLLWASTGTKDPKASDILYVKAIAAPFTVNTMPEGTLKALAAHTEIGELLPAGGGDCEEVVAQFAKAGIDVDALAAQLQEEGDKSFVKSWNDLMSVISSKCALLDKSGAMKSAG